ncbi:MAG: cytochrome C [Candidatus Nitronauta litoralis]|uniref:Cytochrome C n=1 Tax=Candidatus Nitronauta litoralis TaxID=2705533 RepID=A0A7T0G0V7_9BACT|nr:MAG: cytochrome C [Candidatus Nitronauta litoralis]
MLPEQQDILWTFVTIMFTLFSVYVFINVIQNCRARPGVNAQKWGIIFGAFILLSLYQTNHMFDLNQQEQLGYIRWQVLTVFFLLLAWGLFFKGNDVEDQSPPIVRAAFFYSTISILLAGYTNWLPQQRSDPPPKGGAVITGDITMEDFVDMGRVIVFSAKQVAGQKSIGKGQCPLCHTFDPGDNIGRCPNLFGVEERSHTRIKEDRYLNSPIAVGVKDGGSGIVKGKAEEVPEEYRRGGSPDFNGEDYLRESLMCPSCYVVEGYGKEGDTISPMPLIHKPPISLSPVELNAVIAWLQSKDTPGEFAKVTVPLPSGDDAAAEEAPADDGGEAPLFVTGDETPEEIINILGCPLCHTIPGVEGAVGALGPKLHEKTNAPSRMKDARYEGTAKTTKEYVQESILNPSVYIVMNEEEGEPYPDGVMPQDFGSKLSVNALNKLVDFISNTEAGSEG